jgi:hypothetical protein
MQLIPRYLVKNKTTIVTNDTGFITEYRPVYTRQLQVYKGIDNVLEFKLLNADQKPVDLTGYTPKFQAFDENKQMIVQHDGVQVTSDGSTPIKGLFKVIVSSNDLLNVKEQFLSYSIHLLDTNNEASVTYVDPNFENNGSIKVSAEAFPGPSDSYNVTTFTMVTEDVPYWESETITAQPGINGNEALHTAAVYTDSYVGNVVVQATLDNQIMGDTVWADIATLTFTGNETTPTPVNFNGVFSYLRFKATANPADKISKVLVRN